MLGFTLPTSSAHNVYLLPGTSLKPAGRVLSPNPYREAESGRDVEISKYWSLNTKLSKFDAEEDGVELKRLSPVDARVIAKPKGFSV